MRIEPRNAARFEHAANGRRDAVWNRLILAVPRGLMPNRSNGRIRVRHPLLEARDQRFHAAASSDAKRSRFRKPEGEVHDVRLFFA